MCKYTVSITLLMFDINLDSTSEFIFREESVWMLIRSALIQQDLRCSTINEHIINQDTSEEPNLSSRDQNADSAKELDLTPNGRCVHSSAGRTFMTHRVLVFD